MAAGDGRVRDMLLIILFLALFAFFVTTRPASPALVLVAIYLASLLGGLLLGTGAELTTTVEWINLVFVAGMLVLMIAPWNAFPFDVGIVAPNERRLNRLTRTLLAIHAVGFVVFSTTFYLAITSVTDYSAFKNDAGAVAFYETIPINHNLLLLSTYLNSTAAFLVPLHFYYLYRRRIGVSLLCLLFSLNLVLEGISIFSRSVLIMYVVLYTLYLPFFYGRIERNPRRVLKIVGLGALAMFGTVFYVITNNRFADYLSWGEAKYSTSVIQNPIAYSILDYASQWNRNGIAVLSQYDFRTMNGELSFPLVSTLGNRIGVINRPPELIPIRLEELWGDRYDKFVGLVPNLVFDFGYAGTVCFGLLYAIVLFKVRPIRGTISVGTLLILGPLFLLPASGVQNSVMKLDSFNLMILYSVVIYAYLYSKRRDPSSTAPGAEERSS
jgi:hypothetical protein